MKKGVKNALKLNKEQLEAIKYGKGPLLIIAGAGTGKTTVITERVKHLISKGLAQPSEILALTFTEKATREMEERIDKVMPYGYTDMWVMTFHSFCDRILRDEALNIGLDPKFKLLTTAGSIQFIKKNLFNFDLDYFRPLGNPNKFITGMLQHFSRLQDEDITPEQYLKWTKKFRKPKSEEEKLEQKKWKELSKAYKKYDELKTKNSYLDFGDLVIKTLLLFRSRPNVLSTYKEKFKYILVDEFQDTNYSQNELVKLLAGREGNITAVADDDQSIYRFRGAAVSNVVQFRLSFPKSKLVVLIQNYRSTQKILDGAYNLIQNNNPDRLEIVENIDKKLKSSKKEKGDKVEFIYTPRVEDEADRVVGEIKKIVKKNKYDYRDIAILVRANNHADPFVKSFERNSIPHQFLGPGKLFLQSEVSDLISYLKLLYNLNDSVSFYKIASMNIFKIKGIELTKLSIAARKNYTSLFEQAERSEGEELKNIVDMIKDHLELLKNEDVGFVLYDFLKRSGLLSGLVETNSTEAEKKAANISKFFDKLKTFEVDNPESTLEEVVDWINASLELGESPMASNMDWFDENAVNILTIHSAKGLEFPVVFLVNLVEGRFPSINRSDQIPIPEELVKEILPQGNFHIQEERRLFYVAATRAKEKLFLTASNYYGEGKRQKRISPFVAEILGENKKFQASSVKSNLTSKYQKQKPVKKGKQKNKKLNIDYLSVSQIEAFQICPLHYKLRYLYKIPTPPSASASFGISIHETLKDFYDQINKKRTIKPNEKMLIDLLKKNWIKAGYENKKHEKKFFDKGKLYLSGFLKEGFDPKVKTALLEQKFIFPVASSLKIGGTIDRVDIDKDGTLEIVDYKTGATIPSQKEVDKNFQLSVYGLAATKIKNSMFNKKAKDIKLSLYYLDTQEKITTTRTQKQLNETEKELLKYKKEIENSDFKCSNHYFCQNNCEFSIFCKREN